jgi:hypothetical protein
VIEAASRAAALVAAANPPGTERESARTAVELAATVKAAAVVTAEDNAAAAVSVASAVAAAAAGVASTVSAAALAFEREVTAVAATLQATASATARQLAVDTDAQARNVASLAREAASAAEGVDEAFWLDPGAPEHVPKFIPHAISASPSAPVASARRLR